MARLRELGHGQAATCGRSEQQTLVMDSRGEAVAGGAGCLVYNLGLGGGCGGCDPRYEAATSSSVRVSYPSLDQGVVAVVVGAGDLLHAHYQDPAATFLGLPWPQVLTRFGLTEAELWPHLGPDQRTLSTARLFRGRSLQEILASLDLEQSLAWRRLLHQHIFCSHLQQRGTWLPGVRYQEVMQLAVAEGWAAALLATLDSLALEVARLQGPGKLASVLAMTADLLGAMAAGRGGLRSGPAHNPDFRPALRLLEAGHTEAGLGALAAARSRWLDTASRTIRAARHYEVPHYSVPAQCDAKYCAGRGAAADPPHGAVCPGARAGPPRPRLPRGAARAGRGRGGALPRPAGPGRGLDRHPAHLLRARRQGGGPRHQGGRSEHCGDSYF